MNRVRTIAFVYCTISLVSVLGSFRGRQHLRTNAFTCGTAAAGGHDRFRCQ